VPDKPAPIPFGKADIKRAGRDVTVVALSVTVHHALEAAETLAAEGIEIEVVDPRTLVPLDEAAILASVAKTGRLVVADEVPMRCSAASEIAATVAEKGFDLLKAPIVRVTRPDSPVPYSPPLEQAITPDADRIAAAMRKVMKTKRG
jgi:pyruvate dehydrogenase E1 component beta subunit